MIFKPTQHHGQPMKKTTLYAVIILKFLLLSACLPLEEDVLPAPALSVPAPDIFNTVQVAVGDVVLFQDLRTMLVPARQEVLSFDVSGLLIDRVNVKMGDAVKKGDILFELERGHYEQELRQATRELEMVKLRLRQLDERQVHIRERARLLKTEVDTISYQRQHDDLTHQIDLINLKIQNHRNELERRVLRASMDGYVTFLQRFHSWERTTAGSNMVTISDMTETVFIVTESGARLLNIGDTVNVLIRPDEYEGIVIDPAAHNITANRSDFEAFILIHEGYQYGFTTATSGVIRVVLDKTENVLFVPNYVINTYKDRTFVYVLEDDLRTLRDVKVGLVGNHVSEILGGLEAGEVIIVD